MIKKLSAICLLIMAMSLLFSCSAADSFVPSGFKKISNDSAGYMLYVPESWIADLQSGATCAYVSQKDRSNISFMAFELDEALIYVENSATGDGEKETTETQTSANTDGNAEKIQTVDEYWSYYSSNFENTFSDMKYETEGQSILLSKINAKKYVYTATVTGTEYKFMQIVAVKNGTVYIFTYTAQPEIYDSHAEEVDKIVNNIKIEN